MLKFKSIIHRHKSCLGITFFKSKTKHYEIWFCPPGFEIEIHSHDKQDIELMFLYGDAIFYRLVNNVWQSKFVRWFADSLSKFTIKAGVKHYFKVSSYWLVFINFATMLEGQDAISASEDFNY